MSPISYRNAILLTSDDDAVTSPHWRLGTFPVGGELGVMAGWTVANEEGGVPSAVARALARAMTRYGRVTFPCSAKPARLKDKNNLDEGWWQVWAEGDEQAALSHESVPLLSTLQEETVAALLFEDPYYQWWNATQFAIVSHPPEKLPLKPWRFAKDLFEDGWARVASATAERGDLDLVMRSGVDGDVCGIAFASMEVRRAFEDMLHDAAATYGLSVRNVSVADFGQLLSAEAGD